ncbi:MAG: hypothetical protein ACE5H3_06320 [Planctomycetota bacterium]
MKDNLQFFTRPRNLAMFSLAGILVLVLFFVMGGDDESSSPETQASFPSLGLSGPKPAMPPEAQPERVESEGPKEEKKGLLPIPGLDPETVESLRADYLAWYQKALNEENHLDHLREEFFKNLPGYAEKLGPFGQFQAEEFQLGPFFPYNGLQGILYSVRGTIDSFGENPFQGRPGMVKTYDQIEKAFGDNTLRAPPEYQLDRFLEGKAAEWSPDLVSEVHNLWKDYLPQAIILERNQALMKNAIGHSLKNHHLDEALSWWNGKQTANGGGVVLPPGMDKSIEATFPEYRDLAFKNRSLAAEYKRMLLQALQARGFSVNPDWSPPVE